MKETYHNPNTVNTESCVADESGVAKRFTCPVCNAVFYDIHSLASHVMGHSETEKKKEKEEERQRKEKQKKADLARLDKLRKMSEDAFEAYYSAKEKYEKEYGDNYINSERIPFDDLIKCVTGWDRWI